ncbi:MAG: efflux RND transporter periplasmic adaptor subunit [Rickettsiales bacterium]|nr:efflux RND transporter periplasmic adaptor subunit [Rickettsiales bacterium]
MQNNNKEKLPIFLKRKNQEPEESEDSFLHKTPFILLAFFLFVTAGFYFQLPGFTLLSSPFKTYSFKEKTKNLPIKTNQNQELYTNGKYIVGLGTIVPKSKMLSIAAPFGSNDAKIKTILVEIGKKVTHNQLLALLDNRTLLQASVEAAESELAVKEAALKQTISSISWQLEEAKAELQRLQAKVKKAQLDYIRAKELHDQEVIPRSDFEEKESLKLQFEHELNESKARLKSFSENDIENQVDVVVARKNVENAKTQLKLRKEELKKSEIRAPIDGTIIDINAQEGETPPAEGVFYMGDLSQMRVNIDIYQTQISQVKIGTKVDILSDALPQTLTGNVVEKGLLVKRQNRVYDSPTAQTDNRVVEVVVMLDEESSKIAAAFSNLQVIAKIHINDKEDAS